MQAKTTVQLFQEVIHTRGIYHELGLTQMAVKDLRRNHKAGKVSLDKMHEVLHLAGYQIVQETKWAESAQKAVLNVVTNALETSQKLAESQQPKNPSLRGTKQSHEES